MCQWSAALLAQQCMREPANIQQLTVHFGLERVHYASVLRFLAHFQNCKGASLETQLWATSAYQRLQRTSFHEELWTCDVCHGGSSKWDLTLELGKAEALIQGFSVDFSALPRQARKRPNPYVSERVENPRPIKRERREVESDTDDSGTYLSPVPLVALLAIVETAY